jgi:nucleotide-binding universal stress UspA family protein
MADGTGSELHLVHVVPAPSEKPRPYSWTNHTWAKERSEAQLESRRLRGIELLEDQARRVEKELGGTVTATHYAEGSVEEEVVRLGEEIDAGLILTGGRRRSGIERIFDAGLSERLARRTERPVMAVGDREPGSSPLPRNA